MSFWRKHRWQRRYLVGLAFAVMAAPAQARPIESGSPELGLQQPQQAQQPQVIPYLSHGMLGEAVKSRVATEQPPVISYLSHGLTAEDAQGGGQPIPDAFERAVARSVEGTPVRPDDRADRFVVGNSPAPVSVADGDGFSVDWESGVPFAIGGLALVLALGLAAAYLRRPTRIAI